MAVSIVITGMLKYSDKRMNTGAPLSQAFSANGADWASKLISLGAVCGLTTVVLVLVLGQARVLFAMSRDGLIPRKLAKVHPKFGTPYIITIVTGVFVAVLAGVVPLSELKRSFRVPAVPWIPVLAILSCLWLMVNLSVQTWLRFAIWLLIGFVI